MQRTSHSQDELALALSAELDPLGATATTGALLLALVNQETGSAANMWNNNVGNVTTADTTLDYWMTKTGAAKGLRFRAYETLDDGVRDFVRTVRARPKMWTSSGTGVVSQFAQQIRDSKYNPDLDVAGTAPALFTLAKQALPRFPLLAPGDPITLGSTSGTGGFGGLLLVVGLFWLFTQGKGSRRG